MYFQCIYLQCTSLACYPGVGGLSTSTDVRSFNIHGGEYSYGMAVNFLFKINEAKKFQNSN